MLLIITFWLGYALLGAFSDAPSDALSFDLFTIARSKDAKTIQYQINLEPDKSINQEDPIQIFWKIPSTKGVKTQKLTWVQNKYAYGIEILDKKPESITFHFVSYPEKTIQIKQNSEGIYHAYTQCQGQPILVKDIFIQLDGGSFWLPKVSYVKISGKNPETMEETFEIIQP